MSNELEEINMAEEKQRMLDSLIELMNDQSIVTLGYLEDPADEKYTRAEVQVLRVMLAGEGMVYMQSAKDWNKIYRMNLTDFLNNLNCDIDVKKKEIWADALIDVIPYEVYWKEYTTKRSIAEELERKQALETADVNKEESNSWDAEYPISLRTRAREVVNKFKEIKEGSDRNYVYFYPSADDHMFKQIRVQIDEINPKEGYILFKELCPELTKYKLDLKTFIEDRDNCNIDNNCDRNGYYNNILCEDYVSKVNDDIQDTNMNYEDVGNIDPYTVMGERLKELKQRHLNDVIRMLQDNETTCTLENVDTGKKYNEAKLVIYDNRNKIIELITDDLTYIKLDVKKLVDDKECHISSCTQNKKVFIQFTDYALIDMGMKYVRNTQQNIKEEGGKEEMTNKNKNMQVSKDFENDVKSLTAMYNTEKIRLILDEFKRMKGANQKISCYFIIDQGWEEEQHEISAYITKIDFANKKVYFRESKKTTEYVLDLKSYMQNANINDNIWQFTTETDIAGDACPGINCGVYFTYVDPEEGEDSEE